MPFFFLNEEIREPSSRYLQGTKQTKRRPAYKKKIQKYADKLENKTPNKNATESLSLSKFKHCFYCVFEF